MTVGRICTRDVYTADEHETLREAARRMIAMNIGALVILDTEKRPIGIVTDRDLALRGLARNGDAGSLRVADVMTVGPKVADEDMPIEDALSVMRSLPARRLPVVGKDGRLVGIVTLDDVVALLSSEVNRIGTLLARQCDPAQSQLMARVWRGRRVDGPAREV